MRRTTYKEDPALAVGGAWVALARAVWQYPADAFLWFVALGGAVAAISIAGPIAAGGWIIACLLVVHFVQLPTGPRIHSPTKRQWRRTVAALGLLDAGPGPKIVGCEQLPIGERLIVRVPRGSSVRDLDKDASRLAAGMKVREVRIEQDPSNAQLAEVTLVRNDPLAECAGMVWPDLHTERTSMWQPIRLGIDELGRELGASVIYNNLLLGGEPGSGKSGVIQLVTAHAALDPSTKLWLFDGKRVEMAWWRDRAQEIVYTDLESANKTLERICEMIDQRYEDLESRWQRKVAPHDGLTPHLIVIDELAYYLASPEKKHGQRFAVLLRDIVQRGRAAGVVVVAAVQKPASDIIPTSLRDLFGMRLAFRCNTKEASDTILGGWAALGHDASKIPMGQRGTGLLLAEDGRPQRMRTYWLSDDDIRSIAQRASPAAPSAGQG